MCTSVEQRIRLAAIEQLRGAALLTCSTCQRTATAMNISQLYGDGWRAVAKLVWCPACCVTPINAEQSGKTLSDTSIFI